MIPARNNRAVGVRRRHAFVDESQSRSARDPNTYLLAAAVCDHMIVSAVRADIEALRVSGAHKLHWRDEDRKRRRKIAEAIAGMIGHAIGMHEPMLWIADAVCGAVVQFRTGDITYLETIRARAELRMFPIEQ